MRVRRLLSESTADKDPEFGAMPACTAMLQDEKAATQFFQPLPFYYVEISKLLFHDAVEAFGDTYMEVSLLPTLSEGTSPVWGRH